MTYEMFGNGSSISALRAGCDPFDLPSNNSISNNFTNSNYGNNGSNGAGNFPFKGPLAMSHTPNPRPHLTMAEQAELEFELRYRGNMIVDQQRKIQQLEEELKRARDQMDMMNSQITSYEQERQKERKKPQSRYWTPDEHQRFLEALTKYGHKDVKAISMHVSTRNATQVRTHAQKYFLRLERERRKKGDDEGGNKEHEGYNSSGDEMYNSDQSLSPLEELSPSTASIATPPPIVQPPSFQPRRRRSTSLITPALGKSATMHREAVLAEFPNWSMDDFDQFVKGLLTFIDKQEDIPQISRIIRETHLPHLPFEDVEACYRLLNKLLKLKPIVSSPVISSPKRRRTSKPEAPIGLSLMNDGPLPAMGAMSLGSSNGISNSGNSFGSFMGGMPTMSSGGLPLPQYMNGNINTSNNSSVTLLPFQPPLGGLMNMNMRPMHDYSGMPTMAPLQMGNMGNTMNSMGMGMMDMPSSSSSSSSQQQQSQVGWNPLAFSFDLHQNSPSSLNLPQGAPLVSSLN